MTYQLEGDLLEVCDCNVLCPCWIGENPDNGACQSINAYRIKQGIIEGVDVSGLVIGVAVYIPGNVFDGNWRAVRYLDERATPEQDAALLKAFRGQLGGPLADLARLIGDEVEVRRVPIEFTVVGGKGTLRFGDAAYAEMEPYRGPDGTPTQLVESAFSTIPGSPAYVAKAARFRLNQPEIGIDRLDLAGHNAIQGNFCFEA